MRPNQKLFGALLLCGLAAFTVFGCGSLPTAPSPASSTMGAAEQATPSGLLSPIGKIVDGLVGLIVRTLNLVGDLGGSLANGRWRVAIPAGAVNGNATIALGVSTQTSATCQLEILPADQNHFDVPVTLTIDCRSVATDQLRNWVIYWYDPSTSLWVPVQGSQVNLTAKTVSAPLLHFSKYAAGPQTKAGWKPTN